MDAQDDGVAPQVAGDGAVERGGARGEGAHAEGAGLADGREVCPRRHPLVRVH